MDAHPTLPELTRAAYDQAPSPDHVFWCGDCLAILDQMREEREAFRRSRIPRKAGRGFFATLFRRMRRSGS
jgi:hypothetical protein